MPRSPDAGQGSPFAIAAQADEIAPVGRRSAGRAAQDLSLLGLDFSIEVTGFEAGRDRYADRLTG